MTRLHSTFYFRLIAAFVFCQTFFSFALNAQVKKDSTVKIVRCLTTETRRDLQAKGLAESDDKFEDFMAASITQAKEYFSKHAAAARTNGTSVLYKIPIVFHIIHNGEVEGVGSNLGYDQILSQLNRLNLDYQKLNTDAGTVPSWFSPVAANMQLQFVLAKVNPRTGVKLDEPGVDRYKGSKTSYTTTPMTSINTVKAATVFCPDSYMNVWVFNIATSDGTLGIAEFPASSTNCGMPGTPCGNDGGSAETCNISGVVINNTGFGDQLGTATAPYDLGRTLTHESGHYFGLRHTWGDGSCYNDFCDDIPLEKDSYFGAPASSTTKVTSTTYSCTSPGITTTPADGSAASNSGTNGIMYQDYMDYTDDVAMKMFTENQKTRVHVTMWKSPRRNTLASSQAYLLPPDTAHIGSSKDTICIGSSITFSDITSYDTSMAPTKWVWSFQNTGGTGCTAPASVKVTNFTKPISILDGSPTVGTNPTGAVTVTFPAAGVYTATLIDTVFLNTDSAAVASSCTLCRTNWVRSSTKTIVVIPNPSINVTPSGVVSCADSLSVLASASSVTQCGATGKNSFNYSWTPATNLSCSNCGSPTARPTSNTTYTVTALDPNGCSANTSITISACTLPVGINSLTAYQQQGSDKILVNWKVGTELGVQNYLVERSMDGVNYTAIGTVAVSGNKGAEMDYGYVDAAIQNISIVYYRVKMILQTGTIAYSEIAKVVLGKNISGFSVYPNPVENGEVNVMIKNMVVGHYGIRILNAAGQLIYSGSIEHRGGSLTKTISLPRMTSAGVYTIELSSPSGSVEKQKLIIKN